MFVTARMPVTSRRNLPIGAQILVSEIELRDVSFPSSGLPRGNNVGNAGFGFSEGRVGEERADGEEEVGFGVEGTDGVEEGDVFGFVQDSGVAG